MESQRLSDNVSEISENVKAFISLKTDLLKLTLTEKLALIFSRLLVSVTLFLVFLFIFMFLSLAFIFWYHDHVGPLYAGALIVAGFYLILGIIVFLVRNKLFIDPLVSEITKIFLEEEDENK